MSDTSKRNGPSLMLLATCYGCAHERSVPYRHQGDSGSDVYCEHPDAPQKDVGDTRWDTPRWCPLLAQATGEFLEAKASR